MEKREFVEIIDVGSRIQYFRNLKGFSINKLANLAGISQSYLRDVELGNKHPTVDIIAQLCWALEVSLKDFFDIEGTNIFQNDTLTEQLFKLSPDQRSALSAFLSTLV